MNILGTQFLKQKQLSAKLIDCYKSFKHYPNDSVTRETIINSLFNILAKDFFQGAIIDYDIIPRDGVAIDVWWILPKNIHGNSLENLLHLNEGYFNS